MICDSCGGSGWVKDKDDKLDVCEKCWGLGYIDSSQVNSQNPETREEKKLRDRSAYIVIGVLGAYYVSLFAISRIVSMNIFVYLALILLGYYFSSAIGRIYYNHKHGRGRKKGEKKIS